jgi:signal transduction histidine kinase
MKILVMNAIKYTNKGSVIVKIYKNGKKIITQIEDTGIGI